LEETANYYHDGGWQLQLLQPDYPKGNIFEVRLPQNSKV